ncbi:MAG: hypothetical protein GY749_16510 [Desulfobacteraceae bacterium]|nr:hypothetical protein [Desulfobacteraceae bacterium]
MKSKKNIYNNIFCIQIVIFILIIPHHAFAQKTVQKTYCMSATSSSSTDALKKELLSNAKRQAVNEIFGELITAFTKVESGILTEDKIRLASTGLIRIKGNPIFRNGNSFAEMCVSIDAYATEEDRKKFLPTKITKKYCATNPELVPDRKPHFLSVRI